MALQKLIFKQARAEGEGRQQKDRRGARGEGPDASFPRFAIAALQRMNTIAVASRGPE